MNHTKNHGFQFLDFIFTKEEDLQFYSPLAGSFAVIKCDGRVLIVYNKWRQQWELPAGKREGTETAKQCAVRELFEESGQFVENLEFTGLLKLKRVSNGKIKFNPVYTAAIEQLQPFTANDETTEIKLWDGVEEIGCFDEMDLKILEYITA